MWTLYEWFTAFVLACMLVGLAVAYSTPIDEEDDDEAL